MNRYVLYIVIILIATNNHAFETQTHALITRQAYANSVLAQTGEGSVINRLGLDRLEPTAPMMGRGSLYELAHFGDVR